MQIDYDAGDVVVCVYCGPKMSAHGMRKGAMHRVHNVFQHGQKMGVVFSTIGSGKYPGWDATRFKKLPKADSEFTEQMRNLNPHKQKVEARCPITGQSLSVREMFELECG